MAVLNGVIVKKIYAAISIGTLFIIFYMINIHRHIIMMYINQTTEVYHKYSTDRPTIPTTYKDIKYILLWTNPKNTPFVYFGEGRDVFINNNCSFTNCYVTSDRNFLGDYTEFEVIAFNGPELNSIKYINDLPTRRFSKQKYVYANIESAATYPVCTKYWNNYFNWTWTYKLVSTAVWNYFVIRDAENNIIGPNMNMEWMKLGQMGPIDHKLKVSLSTKKRPVAWFVSNCNTVSLREEFVKEVQDHLRNYNLEVDIYGDCGNLQCPKFIMNRCFKMLENKYFFYFAFENSISEDYVTEKILNGLNHNTVPIVFGGANYSRFLPPGSYLDAIKLGPKKLAEEIFKNIHHPTQYYNFFKWKKYYSYHAAQDSSDSDVYCKFCALLNDKNLLRTRTVYEEFSVWWTPMEQCRDVLNYTLSV